jgi:general secretion pathway protein J
MQRRAPITVQGGFTLVELLIALAIAAGLFTAIFGIFQFAGKATEAGEARVVEASNTRLAHAYLRRELSQTFAQRWRDGGGGTSKIAFEGESQSVRFVVPKPANQKASGLTGVAIEVANDGSFDRRNTKIMIRRALLPGDATDFADINSAEPKTLLDGLREARIDYYGAEEDNKDFSWSDSWNAKRRLPRLVRINATDSKGTRLPELVVDLVVGEEAGCYIAAFQRDCPSRR